MRTPSNLSHPLNMALLVALVLACAGYAWGIIIRHDRDDARYIEAAARYTAVGMVADDGVCTLIDAQWVVTAAHVVEDISPFNPTVLFGDRRYAIERVTMHPSWDSSRDEEPSLENVVDLALLRLRQPVIGAKPVLLYEEKDESGMEIVFVGNGNTGTGETGPEKSDGKWRAATNTVAEVRGNWLRFEFNAPPNATDLEGISGPGDSGGPALIERDGRTYIVGVSSHNDGKGGLCRYGSSEFYARISTTRPWIEQMMSENEHQPEAADSDSAFGEIVSLNDAPWPATKAGQAAAAFFTAFGDETAMERFAMRFRSEDAREQRSDKQYADFWREYAAERGNATPLKYVSHGEHMLSVLVQLRMSDAGETQWRRFRFRMDVEPPHLLAGIGITIETQEQARINPSQKPNAE